VEKETHKQKAEQDSLRRVNKQGSALLQTKMKGEGFLISTEFFAAFLNRFFTEKY
jgi:hypothetical protein